MDWSKTPEKEQELSIESLKAALERWREGCPTVRTSYPFYYFLPLEDSLTATDEAAIRELSEDLELL